MYQELSPGVWPRIIDGAPHVSTRPVPVTVATRGFVYVREEASAPDPARGIEAGRSSAMRAVAAAIPPWRNRLAGEHFIQHVSFLSALCCISPPIRSVVVSSFSSNSLLYLLIHRLRAVCTICILA